jgi:hypothetical protein
MGWLTINDFKNLTGITTDDLIVEQALDISFKTIIKRIFTTVQYKREDGTSCLVLDYPIADTDGDGIVTTSDIDIWEEDTSEYEYELSQHVTQVYNNRRRAVVEMDSSYPTTGRKLYVDYKIARDKIEDMVDELKELQKLLTVDYLFTSIPYSKLQRGISNWTINGVSVSFDLSTMNTVKEQNRIREKELFNQLRKVRIDGVAPGRAYHDKLSIYRHGMVYRV